MKYIGALLLIYAVTELHRQVTDFLDWLDEEAALRRRRRLRRCAIDTNLRLYKSTGEEYYIERVRALENESA